MKTGVQNLKYFIVNYYVKEFQWKFLFFNNSPTFDFFEIKVMHNLRNHLIVDLKVWRMWSVQKNDINSFILRIQTQKIIAESWNHFYKHRISIELLNVWKNIRWFTLQKVHYS